MGLSKNLIIFPLSVLLIILVIGTGTSPNASGQPVNFNNSNQGTSGSTPTVDCSAHAVADDLFFQSSACFTNPAVLPSGTIVTCNPTNPPFFGPYFCWLLGYCPPNVAGFAGGVIYCVLGNAVMDNGQSAIITGTGSQQTVANANSVTATFGNLGPGGFIVFIGFMIGIAVLAGISVFGSGENTEAVHMIFMGGILLGLWAILSAAIVVINGSGGFFAQLDAASTSVSGPPIGTIAFVFLTLFYTAGIIGTISRGEAS